MDLGGRDETLGFSEINGKFPFNLFAAELFWTFLTPYMPNHVLMLLLN